IFFTLLGLAALTSSISLLEVPVAFVIDELNIRRKKAAWIVGLLVCCISIVISFDTSLIDLFVIIFNEVGLPLGGLMICLFLGYVWKSESAIDEIEQGFPNVRNHWFTPVWIFFMKYVCPVLIALILVTILLNIFS
ncbi:MAG: sodium-dependent transporter, partial [Balneolaceae bacterium]